MTTAPAPLGHLRRPHAPLSAVDPLTPDDGTRLRTPCEPTPHTTEVTP
jgi:hypothetical protein